MGFSRRMNHYQKLKTIFKRLSHLHYIQRIMQWDEAVMMPEGAGETRADAISTLVRMSQKMLISKKNQVLIEGAKQENNLTLWDRANLQWMEKKYLNAVGVPLALTEQLTKATMASEQAWRKLRAENNWHDFLPHFEKTFRLVKEVAERRSQLLQLAPYDVLLDDYAPGFTQKNIDSIFLGLKTALPVLAEKIIERQKSEKVMMPQGIFSIAQQKSLGQKVMQDLQFDFQHGRLDVSHHPFCSGGPTDVRMTTRYSEDEFLSSLFGICHETGHALYEQGLPREWIDQPVGQVDSMAMHESQSLLVEMEVCRSLPFLKYLAPMIKAEFSDQEAFSAENLYKVITRVKPNLIRVDADEVTYPLHIVLRYEIEKRLFLGEIDVKDLPHCWDSAMQKYLGISTQGNDKDGVMQDVHWPSGAFGYFPAYTLGRLIASQFFAAYGRERPEFKKDFAAGNFIPLRGWLKEKIHSEASALSTNDLLLKVTGESLNADYFINHVSAVYS
jgi:carboxypeptidase Taq